MSKSLLQFVRTVAQKAIVKLIVVFLISAILVIYMPNNVDVENFNIIIQL